MRGIRVRMDGVLLVVAAVMVLVAGASLGGCGLSREAQAHQDDWIGRADRSVQARQDGRAAESAELLAGLWEQKATTPQPEGGMPERALVCTTVGAMKDERVKGQLAPRLEALLARLEDDVKARRADGYATEVWFDLAVTLDDRESMRRVVAAGKEDRSIVKPLLNPPAQRELLAELVATSSVPETAKVLELTDGEAFAEGAAEVLRFGTLLTPGLLASQ